MKKTLLASAVLMAFAGTSAMAATTDYSNKTVTEGIIVSGAGNTITGNNLKVTGSALVEAADPDRYEGIFVGRGGSASFGGDELSIKFAAPDGNHEFAGIQINGHAGQTADAVFNSKNTVIDVSGDVKSGLWGFGLLVNGSGQKTASAKFTGGNVVIKTTTKNYTSQSLTVKSNASIDFSNTGDVEVHAYSPYGVTVVDAAGELTFNNAGNVLLKGEIRPGDKTASTNVVGIQGHTAGAVTVTNRVKTFQIDLKGAGVDNNGTSYSTGTKAISANGVKMSINPQAFVVNMDANQNVTDVTPEGHTAVRSYAIFANLGGEVTIGKDTVTSLTVNDALGTGYGIYAGNGATVDLAGNVEIKATGKTGGEALTVDGTDVEAEPGTTPAVKPATVTLQGAKNVITGDVKATNQGNLALKNGSTTVTGKMTVDNTSQMGLEKAGVELAKGSTLDVQGTLTSKEGEVVLNDAAAGTVKVATLAEGSTLKAVATPELNDALGGDLKAFESAVAVTTGAAGTTLLMKEGMVAGETSAKLTADGKVDDKTVTVKTNSLMESTLGMASRLPLVMTRMLTNDVRKRLGNLRDAEGDTGVWARYDGGRFSGDGGFESDFHTIQVGADTLIAPDMPRVGFAFSYSSGETDYARGTADTDAMSLAAYATWMADNGLFVDGVARIAKVKNEMEVDGNLKGDMDNMVYALSGEAGMRFDLSPAVYVEPQVEVTYARVDAESFRVGEAIYNTDAVDSLTARAGFVSGLTFPDKKGDAYLRVSVVHEFLGDADIVGKAKGHTARVTSEGKDTWVEYGIGTNYSLTKNTYLWADLERTSGGVIDEDWRGTIGVRHAF